MMLFFTSAYLWNNKDDEKIEDKENIDSESQRQQPTNEKEELNKPTAEAELKELAQKFKQLQSQYLLALADQENLRQRTAREVNNAREFSIQKFAKDILDSVDILNMALKSVPEDLREKESCLQKEKTEIVDQLSNLYTGVSMTETELLKTLKRYDIVMDDPIDQEFDPNKHEAIFQAPVPDKKPGTIFVVQKVGYMMKNRTLRPAQVGVVAEVQS
ncbi:unnamed protein product [Mucor hiemalis]